MPLYGGLDGRFTNPQFAPRGVTNPPWLRAPRLPVYRQPGTAGAQRAPSTDFGPPAPWMTSGGQSGTGRVSYLGTPLAPTEPDPGLGLATGFNNPFTGQSFTHTAPSYAIDALAAAGLAGLYNPNIDPITELLRTQGFQDYGARQNAARLGARLQGGGDPYLEAFAALQSQMGGQSDLSRLLGSSQLQSAQRNQDFFRDLLMQLLRGSTGIIAEDYSHRREKGTGLGDIGALLGGIGSLVGALPKGRSSPAAAGA